MFHLRDIEGSRCPNSEILYEDELLSFIRGEDRKWSYLFAYAVMYSPLPPYEDFVSSLVKTIRRCRSRILESRLHP